MLKALETGEPYPIKMGFYAGNNLMTCTSMEPKRWHDAIVKSLEFCIGFDTFMNASIEASCDVFLPLKTVAERDGTVFTHYAPCTVTAGFMHKAIEVGECLTDYELCYEMGRRLRPELWEKEFAFRSAKEFMEALRLGERQDGAYFDKVSECVVSQIPVDYYKYERGEMRADGQPGFATPTGRIELLVHGVQPVRRRPAALLPGARVRAGRPRAHEGVPLHPHHGRAHAGVLPFGAPPGGLPARSSTPTPSARSIRPLPRGSASRTGSGCA